jgi:hypothetical protein
MIMAELARGMCLIDRSTGQPCPGQVNWENGPDDFLGFGTADSAVRSSTQEARCDRSDTVLRRRHSVGVMPNFFLNIMLKKPR